MLGGMQFKNLATVPFIPFEFNDQQASITIEKFYEGEWLQTSSYLWSDETTAYTTYCLHAVLLRNLLFID
jgi:hypothetical protein